MANKFRGETDIIIQGMVYTLRPTFHAICCIEQRVKKSIAQLLSEASEGRMLFSDVITIMQCCLLGGEKEPGKILFSDEGAIKECTKQIVPMLLAALGADYEKKEEDKPDFSEAGQEYQNEPPFFDWHSMMAAAVMRFNISSLQFWKMTMPEYKAIQQAYMNELENTGAIINPPTRLELKELMEKFPDKKPSSGDKP